MGLDLNFRYKLCDISFSQTFMVDVKKNELICMQGVDPGIGRFMYWKLYSNLFIKTFEKSIEL